VKYLCLGYHDEQAWSALDNTQREKLLSETFQFRDELIKGGHCIDDKALTGANEAVTLRFAHSGTLAVTDGPFAETKEQLGGVMLLEATDLNHAIQLMSRLPCMRVGGSLEIRPINEALLGERQ
jgi:hypothetical protein